MLIIMILFSHDVLYKKANKRSIYLSNGFSLSHLPY